MTVVVLPTAYPNVYNEHAAIFVQDHVKALAQNKNLKLHVVGAIPISLKDVCKTRTFSFGFTQSSRHGVATTLILFPAIPKLRRLNNFIRTLLNKKLLKKYTKVQGTPDIIHVHNVVAAEAALWYQKTYATPYYITEHSSAFGRGLLTAHELRSYERLYHHAECNIAVSQKLADDLHRITSENFRYIPNVTHTDFFKPAAHRTPSNTFTFVHIANLNDNKNQALLVEAFCKFAAIHADARLRIVGEGPNYNMLQEKIQTLHMQHQITLYGFATRDDVRMHLQQSDAFVLSSNYETFGVVVIEAMSCGLPILSTKCGGPESIIVNDRLGILVDNTLEALFEGMQKMVQTDYNTDDIRDYAVKNFSEKIIGEQFVSLYTKMASRTPKVASFVFNPFTHDSRVLKEALTLHHAHYDVTVVAHGNKGLQRHETCRGIHITRLAYLDR
ncbi:MAG: hypothetical protein DSZ03_04970, partial [Sulfurimonas sp.]